MTVYIVTEETDHGYSSTTDIVAVFSTEEGAYEFVKAQKTSFRTSYDWIEKELDKP